MRIILYRGIRTPEAILSDFSNDIPYPMKPELAPNMELKTYPEGLGPEKKATISL